MNRAIAQVAAAIALAVAGAVVVMPLAAFAKDNPGTPSGRPGNPGHHYGEISNPGHHYGQLKHHPAPTPNPSPNPTPNPTTHPTTNPGHHTGTPQPAVVLAGHGATSSETVSSGVSDVTIGAPAQNQVQNSAATEIPANVWDLEWLLLLILPALLAIWVIVAARIVRSALRRRAAPAAGLAPARATV